MSAESIEQYKPSRVLILCRDYMHIRAKVCKLCSCHKICKIIMQKPGNSPDQLLNTLDKGKGGRWPVLYTIWYKYVRECGDVLRRACLAPIPQLLGFLGLLVGGVLVVPVLFVTLLATFFASTCTSQRLACDAQCPLAPKSLRHDLHKSKVFVTWRSMRQFQEKACIVVLAWTLHSTSWLLYAKCS